MDHYISLIKMYFSKNRARVLIIALLGFIVYSNALSGDFVSDDIPGFLENPSTKDFKGSLLSLNFQKSVYAASFLLFHNSPTPLHVISVLLHILAAIGVLMLADLLTDNKVGFVSALFFVVHPVNTEAVSWISAVNYVANGLGFLLSAIPYLLYFQTRNTRYLISSAAIFFVTFIFFQNPWAIITPILLLCLSIDKGVKQNIKCLLVFLLPSLLIAVQLNPLAQARYSDLSSTPEINMGIFNVVPYHIRIPYTLSEDLRLLVYPKDLLFYHEGLSIDLTKYWWWVGITSVFVLITGTFLATRRKIGGQLIFIIASIIPTLSPVPLSWFVAERYLYISSMIYSILLAQFCFYLARRTKNRSLGISIVVLIILVFSARTYLRTTDWSNTKNLALATLAVFPESSKAYNDLGNAYNEEGRYERAKESYQKAISLNPRYSDAMYNLGVTLFKLEETGPAYNYFQQAFRLDSKNYQALYNAAAIEASHGMYEEAANSYTSVIKLNPSYHDAWFNLGVTYSLMEKDQEALHAYTVAYSLDNQDFRAAYNIAFLYSKYKDHTNALKWLGNSLVANPSYEEAKVLLKQIKSQNVDK